MLDGVDEVLVKLVEKSSVRLIEQCNVAMLGGFDQDD